MKKVSIIVIFLLIIISALFYIGIWDEETNNDSGYISPKKPVINNKHDVPQKTEPFKFETNAVGPQITNTIHNEVVEKIDNLSNLKDRLLETEGVFNIDDLLKINSVLDSLISKDSEKEDYLIGKLMFMLQLESKVKTYDRSDFEIIIDNLQRLQGENIQNDTIMTYYYIINHEFEAAKFQADLLVEKYPRDALSYYYLAQIYWLNKDKISTKKLLKKAVSLDSKNSIINKTVNKFNQFVNSKNDQLKFPSIFEFTLNFKI